MPDDYLQTFPSCRIKKLSELATLIDKGSTFFTRKIKKLNRKLLEIKT